MPVKDVVAGLSPKMRVAIAKELAQQRVAAKTQQQTAVNNALRNLLNTSLSPIAGPTNFSGDGTPTISNNAITVTARTDRAFCGRPMNPFSATTPAKIVGLTRTPSFAIVAKTDVACIAVTE